MTLSEKKAAYRDLNVQRKQADADALKYSYMADKARKHSYDLRAKCSALSEELYQAFLDEVK